MGWQGRGKVGGWGEVAGATAWPVLGEPGRLRVQPWVFKKLSKNPLGKQGKNCKIELRTAFHNVPVGVVRSFQGTFTTICYDRKTRTHMRGKKTRSLKSARFSFICIHNVNGSMYLPEHINIYMHIYLYIYMYMLLMTSRIVQDCAQTKATPGMPPTAS